jgi:hypothetical protein
MSDYHSAIFNISSLKSCLFCYNDRFMIDSGDWNEGSCTV